MIKTYKEYIECIQADALVNSRTLKMDFKRKIKEFFFPDLIWTFIRSLRKTEYLKNQNGLIYKILFLFSYHKYRKLSYKLGFSIPLNVFGPGISIPHYGTIVVNSNTRVGRNCRIHASVNIGASGGTNKAPFIGDNVYIGPGSILFGEIFIADNITIAANATVYRTFVNRNCTIGGTPAIVLKENTTTWWEKNGLSL